MIVLRVEQPHVIRMTIEYQLFGVLDRYEAFVCWNFANKRFSPRGLARTGWSGHQNILAAFDRQAHERCIVARCEEAREFALCFVLNLTRA